MLIWQLCANLLIPNCLRSNLSYSLLAALELYVNHDNSNDDTKKALEELQAEAKRNVKLKVNDRIYVNSDFFVNF